MTSLPQGELVGGQPPGRDDGLLSPRRGPFQLDEVAYQYLDSSDGAQAAAGSWASGPSPDGSGRSSYHEGPTTTAAMPGPTTPDPRLYGTTATPNVVEQVKGKIEDVL